MSAALMAWVAEHSPFTNGAYAAHVALAYLADDDGNVRASQTEVGRAMRYSDRNTVRLAIRELLDAGAVLLVEPKCGPIAALMRVTQSGASPAVEPVQSGASPAVTPAESRGQPSVDEAESQGQPAVTDDDSRTPPTSRSIDLDLTLCGPVRTEPTIEQRAHHVRSEVLGRPEPKPAARPKTIGDVARRLLEAGYTEDAIIAAMNAAPTISVAACEFHLRRGVERKPDPNRNISYPDASRAVTHTVKELSK